MKRNVKLKTTITALLAASCIGTALSGCAAKAGNADEQNPGQEITAEDMQTLRPVADEPPVNENTETIPDEPAINETAANNPDAESEAQTDSTETQKTAPSSQSLYEQFLNNSISMTFNSNYTKNEYLAPILENGNSYTIAELGECVSRYYLDPERTDKTSYDYVQYAYVECPDSADANDRNLLVKFVGLNIYCSDDDSYAVFVITDDNGHLYVTDQYECWARSETTAYSNGTLGDSGSAGAGDHYAGLSVILSNGKNTPIYSTEELFGWWTGHVGGAIYSEVFDENTECNLIVSIHTIGNNKYYQYSTSYCSEEEIPLCENYITRCRDEAGINWVTDEEIQTAIQNQCGALGIDYSITQNQNEAVWNNL